MEGKLADQDEAATYTKKEILELNRKKEKILKAFNGIRNMGDGPSLIVVIDTNKEHIAEANVLGIPIVVIVDTNSNPDNLEHPVPSNDDILLHRSIT